MKYWGRISVISGLLLLFPVTLPAQTGSTPAATQNPSITKAQSAPTVSTAPAASPNLTAPAVPFATIDGIAVTATQVRAAAAAELESLELQRMQQEAEYQQKEYEALNKALDQAIENTLLDLEAKKRGITKDELINVEVTQKTVNPTDAEIDSFYEENKDQIKQPKTAVAERIKKYLRERSARDARRNLMTKIAEGRQIVRTAEPFRFPVTAEGRPALGPDNAPVELILFSDFECQYCHDYRDTLKEIVKNYGDKVRLVFRQFPLSHIHAYAQLAAEASLCAADQNRFWELHDLMFDHQKKLSEAAILADAKQLGLDMNKFNACLKDGRHQKEIQADIRAAAHSAVDSTPTLFINGILMVGGQPYDVLAEIIDSELGGRQADKKTQKVKK